MSNRVLLGVFLLVGLFLVGQSPQEENQRMADLGNGYYQNPIIPGRFADPSVVKVGSDYYMTHSMGGTPLLLVWHSKDLVNWEPLEYAAKEFYGNSWAPDISYHKGKFYIYTTFVTGEGTSERSFENYVLIADDPKGPWSKPININVKAKIDPGHLTAEDGKRYLYFNKGTVYELDETGTKTIGEPKQVYEGWEYPEEWIVECFCLEGPKMFFKDGYYYMVTAEGGTTGPATSHMTVVARSKSPLGPFENSPYNPLIKTRSKTERWWSQGHSTLIEAPDGQWYSIHHGYEKDYRHVGRQTLMVPIDWSNDGWPINKKDDSAMGLYNIPRTEKRTSAGMSLSDTFKTKNINTQWRSFSGVTPETYFTSGEGKLRAKANGTHIGEAATLGILPVNTSYEVSVKATLEQGTFAGIVLGPRTFNAENPTSYGVGLENNSIVIHHTGRAKDQQSYVKNAIHLKLRNHENDIVLFYSENGRVWNKLPLSMEVINIKSLAVMLYAYGEGTVVFEDFKYLGLE